jgi:hypothetical protein
MPCVVCHKPTPSHFVYCPRHRRFGELAADDQSVLAIRDAMIEGWVPELDGCICKYCGRLLNETNPQSPDYTVFDHYFPLGAKLVTCCRRCNSMKNALTGPEFIVVIPALSDYWLLGIPFRKDLIGFDDWDWKRLALTAPMLPPRKVAPFEARIKKYIDCLVCHDILYPKSRYCARCRRFITGQHDNAEKAKAMIESWDPERHGFADYYTGNLVDEVDWKSPWYRNFDHIVPGKPKMALSSAWTNRMKGNMTESQFRTRVPALADHIRSGAPFKPRKVDGR